MRDFDAASSARVRGAVSGWVESHAGRRNAPRSGPAQTRFVLRDRYGGSTRAMARDYGVSQRTVQRWLKGDRSLTRSEAGRRVSTDVGRIRERRAARHTRAAIRRGDVPRVRMKANIGPAGGQRDYRRVRTITRALTPDEAERLVSAQQAGDAGAVRDVLSDAFGGYFNNGTGGQARTSTGADIGEVDWLEFE